VLLLASIPVHYVLNHYRKWTSSKEDPLHEEYYSHKNLSSRGSAPEDPREVDGYRTDLPPPSFEVESSNRTRTRGSRNGSAHGNAVSRRSHTPNMQPGSAAERMRSSGIPQPATRTTRASTRQPRQPPDSAPPPYEIWYPPSTSYETPTPNTLSGLPTPPADNPPPFDSSPSYEVEADSADDWRQYPAFPSAYPATPLPVPPRLPAVDGNVIAPVPLRPGKNAAFSDIVEEPIETEAPPDLSGDDDLRIPMHQQDFQRSLPSARESLDPDSAADSSDDQYNTRGVQYDRRTDDVIKIDEETDEDEDDFNVTLQTPFPKIRIHEAQKEKSLLTSPSMESLNSQSTALSTTDNGSSLRTRTNSAASTTLSTSDASSMAGRKRRLPPTELKDVDKLDRLRVRPKIRPARPTAVQLQSRMRAAARERSKASKESATSATADEDTAETDSDASGGDSSDLKRRRVPGVPGNRLPRPAPERGDSDRTIRAPTRKTMIEASNVRPSSRRPASRVVDDEGTGTIRARRPASTTETRTRSSSRR